MAYWLIAVVLALLAFVPIEATLCGVFVPNMLQIAMPFALVLAVGAFFTAKVRRGFVLTDLIVVLLGLWGLIGLFMTPGYARWKDYGNGFMYPMGFYYVARLLPLDRKSLVRLINVNLVAVTGQSLLMILQRRLGSSPLYTTVYDNTDWAAGGPMAPFEAGAYMALWPPLFVYIAATTKSRSTMVLASLGLILNLFAVMSTTQRAATGAALVAIAFLAVAPKLRPALLKLALMCAIVYVPASDGDVVNSIRNRFNLIDESRVAYSLVGWRIVHSDHWDPMFGVGFKRAEAVMRQLGEIEDERSFTAWGHWTVTLDSIARGGHPLHSIYLATIVEFGSGGAILGASLLLALSCAFAAHHVRSKRRRDVDYSLVIALCGGLVSFLVEGKFHNAYTYIQALCVFWFLYGMVVGRPDVFVIREDGVSEIDENEAILKLARSPITAYRAMRQESARQTVSVGASGHADDD